MNEEEKFWRAHAEWLEALDEDEPEFDMESAREDEAYFMWGDK